ncbi:hypothetical protein EYF80_043963 [Liparis tanakae]|uniref:Uncharacterized protein n=1 Tax=Liparis tanakae TaxID=230148 RepID=A0A4Z2FX15_9TELE|nr:hypothetical protein EYF80_043963 [Liparis tanakae]
MRRAGFGPRALCFAPVLYTNLASVAKIQQFKTVKPRPRACWEPSGLGDKDTSSKTIATLGNRRQVVIQTPNLWELGKNFKEGGEVSQGIAQDKRGCN